MQGPHAPHILKRSASPSRPAPSAVLAHALSHHMVSEWKHGDSIHQPALPSRWSQACRPQPSFLCPLTHGESLCQSSSCVPTSHTARDSLAGQLGHVTTRSQATLIALPPSTPSRTLATTQTWALHSSQLPRQQRNQLPRKLCTGP